MEGLSLLIKHTHGQCALLIGKHEEEPVADRGPLCPIPMWTGIHCKHIFVINFFRNVLLENPLAVPLVKVKTISEQIAFNFFLFQSSKAYDALGMGFAVEERVTHQPDNLVTPGKKTT